MAQVRGSLSSVPQTVEGASLPSSFPQFVVRFSHGFFLSAYKDSGAIVTAFQDRARIFHDRKQAESIARMLGGEVCEFVKFFDQKGEGDRKPRAGARGPSVQSREASLSSVEICAKVMVELAGGIFLGLLPAIPRRSEPLILFKSPQTKTTLGILLSELNAELVRKILAASDAAFDAKVQPGARS